MPSNKRKMKRIAFPAKFKISVLEAEREAQMHFLNAICLSCGYYLHFGFCSHPEIDPHAPNDHPIFIPKFVIKDRTCKYFVSKK